MDTTPGISQCVPEETELPGYPCWYKTFIPKLRIWLEKILSIFLCKAETGHV